MWGKAFFSKSLWAGLLWGPLSGVIPPPPILVVGGGGSYGKGKKKKQPAAISFEQRVPSARQSLQNVLNAIQDRQDEEDLLMLLNDL